MGVYDIVIHCYTHIIQHRLKQKTVPICVNSKEYAEAEISCPRGDGTSTAAGTGHCILLDVGSSAQFLQDEFEEEEQEEEEEPDESEDQVGFNVARMEYFSVESFTSLVA